MTGWVTRQVSDAVSVTEFVRTEVWELDRAASDGKVRAMRRLDLLAPTDAEIARRTELTVLRRLTGPGAL
jgi:hypothetical protein